MNNPSLSLPSVRIRTANSANVSASGDFVLYWMTTYRRLSWNFALQRAADWARSLDRPLVVLEALRCDYPWASDRLHAFVLQGMADHTRAARGRPEITYFPYVERARGEGRGLLGALAERACLVVTDDWPGFFLPHMLARAADQLPILLEAVDSAGLLPTRATERVFKRAVDFRRFLQRELPPHLTDLPLADPLCDQPRRIVDLGDIQRQWTPASRALLDAESGALATLPIDHTVSTVEIEGGPIAAKKQLERFLADRLSRYSAHRGNLATSATSGLSPYLHFGHIAPHQIFSAIADSQGWSPDRLGAEKRGAREGWWGMDEDAEAFVDQLVTWRELGFNAATHLDNYDRYESLPGWAIRTLAEHDEDPRQPIYELAQFETASTHDAVWNAGQRELRETGTLHNRMRMLWGKKILEWAASPHEALAIMLQLNNKYALDGRDPNSVSGIFWVLGRYDRAWGPERPIFGKVRYMSSDSMRRKPGARAYIERWSRENVS